MNEKTCPWCHTDENGDYSMYKFIHPSDPERTATLSFYDGKLAIEMAEPDEDEPNRLACEIEFCPKCGRAFTQES